jgi:hypothetical protein
LPETLDLDEAELSRKAYLDGCDGSLGLWYQDAGRVCTAFPLFDLGMSDANIKTTSISAAARLRYSASI